MARSEIVRLVPRSGGIFTALRDPLYRSSYALLANTAATTVVGVAYWAVAAHFYDQQVLGRSAALVSALMLVSSFAQLNLANALPRFIPKAGKSAGKFILCSYGASSGAALIGGLAFVTILPRLSSQWQFVRGSPLLAAVFVVAVVVWEIFTLQDIALLSLRRPLTVPLENSVYGVSKLFMLVGVVSLLPSTGIFLSWVLPLAITVPAVNWLIFRRFLKERTQTGVRSDLRAGEVVRFASVDYVGSVLSQSYGSLLPLLVLSTLGAAANSSFYIAWTIASGLGLVAANFGTSLLVEGAASPSRLPVLTRGVLARCITITSLGAALLVVVARPILEVYGAKYAVHATSLLGLLAIGTIPSSVVVVAISLDRIAGKVGRATLTRLILTLLVLGGSWVLGRRVGIDGVAYAWGGANLVVALLRAPTIVVAARQQSVPSRVRTQTRRALANRHSQVPGIHRRQTTGRHRAGAIRSDQPRRPERLSRSLQPSGVRVSASATASDVDIEAARALEVLMSLSTEVSFR